MTIAMLAAAAAVGGPARAEVLLLDDGTTRTGQILSMNNGQIELLVAEGGIRGTWRISASRVAAIVADGQPLPVMRKVVSWSQADFPPPQVLPAPERRAAPQRSEPAPVRAKSPPASPNQIERLKNAVVQASGSPPAVLLKALSALARAGGAAPQLDDLAENQHGTSFGQWLADTRWAAVRSDYAGARFDLRGVTEVERPALLAIVQGQTLAAVTPLREFMPGSSDTRTAPASPHPVGRREKADDNPLYRVTLDNCQQVRREALLATAVLRAQLELDPDMAADDAQAIRADLGRIYPILARSIRGSRIVEMRAMALARGARR
jgi:hypothetical protein